MVVVIVTVILVITCVLNRRSRKRKNVGDTDNQNDTQSNRRMCQERNSEIPNEYAELSVIMKGPVDKKNQKGGDHMHHGEEQYENVPQCSSFNNGAGNSREEHIYETMQ